MYISKKNGITSSSIQLLSNITMVILPDKFYFEVTDIGTSFTVYVNGIFSSKPPHNKWLKIFESYFM